MYVVGDYVKIKDQNISGFVTAVTSKYITILANDKIVKVAMDNTEKAIPNKVQSSSVKINIKLSSPPLDEIMIRHQTVEEALFNLEKFIDNAICNNVKIVKIIHGKNGGILRREVHKYLDNSPFVKEHRLGGYYEGSYGVTIAFLK